MIHKLFYALPVIFSAAWPSLRIRLWDIPCQLTPLFCRPSPILLKFGMFVGLDEKMSHTKFQVSKSNSYCYIKVEN